MSQYCIDCKTKRNPIALLESNYAGFHLKVASFYPFPERIEMDMVPSAPSSSYLCINCIKKYQVRCKIHGPLNQNGFSSGKPPVCQGCEQEAKAICQGALFPDIDWNIPITELYDKNGKNVGNGRASFSAKYGYLYLASKSIIACYPAKALKPILRLCGQDICFEIEMVGALRNSNCCRLTLTASDFTNLEKPNLLMTAKGSWINFWNNAISEKLGLNSQLDVLYLASIERETPLEGSMEPNRESVFPICLLSLDDKGFYTFPSPIHRFPIFANLKNIRHETTGQILRHTFFFEENHVPIKLRITSLWEILWPSLEKALINFGVSGSKTISTSGELYSQQGLYTVYLHPNSNPVKALLEVKTKSVSCKVIPEGRSYTFEYGFNNGRTWLLWSGDLSTIASVKLDSMSSDAISGALTCKSQIIKLQHNTFVYPFLSKTLPSHARILSISSDGVQLDQVLFIPFEKLECVSPKDVETTLGELTIHYDGDKFIQLLGPRWAVYEMAQNIEVYKATHQMRDMGVDSLYDDYNKLKKQSLLINLFSDILLLNVSLQEIDDYRNLSEKLSKIDAEAFHNDTLIRNKTSKMVLIMSTILPEIRRKMEYLAMYYPYYLGYSERQWLCTVFGEHADEHVGSVEMKRIVPETRNLVRTVQANLQRSLGEVEMSIRRTSDIFAHEQVNTPISKLAKYSATVAPILIPINMMLLGGSGAIAVSAIAGMIGIRALTDVLRYFKNDQESSARLLFASRSMLSWWEVFVNTFAVTAYEVSQAMDKENKICRERDRRILQTFQEKDRPKVEAVMREALKARITTFKENNFSEVMEGAGIRIFTLQNDLKTAIEKMDDGLSSFSKKVPKALVMQDNLGGSTNG